MFLELQGALLAAASTPGMHQPAAADMAYALMTQMQESGKHSLGSGATQTQQYHHMLPAAVAMDESDNDFDEEDSVPDPESFVVSSSDRPETFSVGTTETLFADASVFAPANALFLLDDGQQRTTMATNNESHGGSLAAAMAIASAMRTRPLSKAPSGRATPLAECSVGPSSGSDEGGSDSSGSDSGAEAKQPMVNNESDDEHSNTFFVDPTALASPSTGMYFDNGSDGGFTRFLNMHVDRQQTHGTRTPAFSAAVTSAPLSATTQRAPTAVSAGLLLDSDLLANPMASLGFGASLMSAPAMQSAVSSQTAVPGANPFMLPGSGHGPAPDADPITAAFYRAFGFPAAHGVSLPTAPPAMPQPQQQQQQPGLNPSAAAALASQLARHQLSAASAQLPTAGSAWKSVSIADDSVPPSDTAIPSAAAALASKHQSFGSAVQPSTNNVAASSEALQMMYFSELARRASAAAGDSSGPLPHPPMAAPAAQSLVARHNLATDRLPRTINPSAIDLPPSRSPIPQPPAKRPRIPSTEPSCRVPAPPPRELPLQSSTVAPLKRPKANPPTSQISKRAGHSSTDQKFKDNTVAESDNSASSNSNGHPL
ncbi:hypothetical protein H4R24_005396, partial [Coemansia sp. RSA 988]